MNLRCDPKPDNVLCFIVLPHLNDDLKLRCMSSVSTTVVMISSQKSRQRWQFCDEYQIEMKISKIDRKIHHCYIYLQHQPMTIKDSLCNHLPGRVLLALQPVFKKANPNFGQPVPWKSVCILFPPGVPSPPPVNTLNVFPQIYLSFFPPGCKDQILW